MKVDWRPRPPRFVAGRNNTVIATRVTKRNKSRNRAFKCFEPASDAGHEGTCELRKTL